MIAWSKYSAKYKINGRVALPLLELLIKTSPRAMMDRRHCPLVLFVCVCLYGDFPKACGHWFSLFGFDRGFLLFGATIRPAGQIIIALVCGWRVACLQK